MDHNTKKLTYIHSVIVIVVITVLTLLVYLAGSWATYPTERHRATAQEQKEFLERNGLFSGAKEYEDLKNTPEALYSRTASEVSSVVQYLFYVLAIAYVYVYFRKRRKRAIILTTFTSVAGSLLGTAIIIAFSNNLSNLTAEFSQIIFSVLFMTLVFVIVTFFIVCGIHFLFNRFQKNKNQAPRSAYQKGERVLEDSRTRVVKNLSKVHLARPKSVFTGLVLFTGAIAVGASALPVLSVSGTCTQEEYVRLKGDCALTLPSTTSIANSSVSGKTDDLQKSFVNSTVSIRPLGADRNEGNSGMTELTYTVKRSGDLSSPASIDWYVQTGTETVQTAGRVNFTKNEASSTIAIKVRGNTRPEPDKNLVVCIGTSSGLGVDQNNSCAKGVVRNDDKSNTCGFNATTNSTLACTTSAINRNINTPVSTSIRAGANILNNVSNSILGLLSPLVPRKTLVTMGDSYEIGIPKACVNINACQGILKTLFSPGVLRSLIGVQDKACAVQDYTSSNLTLGSLNNLNSNIWSANNVACGGSKTTQMQNGWQWFVNPKLPSIPSQLNALNSPNIGLVVLSTGGNDVLFPEQGEPSIMDCLATILCDTNSEVYKLTLTKLNALYNKETRTGNLINFYQEIRNRTNAPIIVQGYPVYFGDKQYVTSKSVINSKECDRFKKQGQIPAKCYTEFKKYVTEAPGCIDFENSERKIGRDIEQRLNSAIRAAVNHMNEKYSTNQFIYVDPFAPGRFDFTKDQICAISSTKPITGPTEFSPIPAHPNVNGVQRRSQQVFEAYQNYVNRYNVLRVLAQ